MKWHKATKHQLLQIALYEDCPMEYKSRAAAELQTRWSHSMLADLIYLYSKGEPVFYIAEYLGTDEQTLGGMISKYKLRRVAG
jgi:hypothetical protein